MRVGSWHVSLKTQMFCTIYRSTERHSRDILYKDRLVWINAVSQAVWQLTLPSVNRVWKGGQKRRSHNALYCPLMLDHVDVIEAARALRRI